MLFPVSILAPMVPTEDPELVKFLAQPLAFRADFIATAQTLVTKATERRKKLSGKYKGAEAAVVKFRERVKAEGALASKAKTKKTLAHALAKQHETFVKQAEKVADKAKASIDKAKEVEDEVSKGLKERIDFSKKKQVVETKIENLITMEEKNFKVAVAACVATSVKSYYRYFLLDPLLEEFRQSYLRKQEEERLAKEAVEREKAKLAEMIGDLAEKKNGTPNGLRLRYLFNQFGKGTPGDTFIQRLAVSSVLPPMEGNPTGLPYGNGITDPGSGSKPRYNLLVSSEMLGISSILEKSATKLGEYGHYVKDVNYLGAVNPTSLPVGLDAYGGRPVPREFEPYNYHYHSNGKRYISVSSGTGWDYRILELGSTEAGGTFRGPSWRGNVVSIPAEGVPLTRRSFVIEKLEGSNPPAYRMPIKTLPEDVAKWLNENWQAWIIPGVKQGSYFLNFFWECNEHGHLYKMTELSQWGLPVEFTVEVECYKNGEAKGLTRVNKNGIKSWDPANT